MSLQVDDTVDLLGVWMSHGGKFASTGRSRVVVADCPARGRGQMAQFLCDAAMGELALRNEMTIRQDETFWQGMEPRSWAMSLCHASSRAIRDMRDLRRGNPLPIAANAWGIEAPRDLLANIIPAKAHRILHDFTIEIAKSLRYR